MGPRWTEPVGVDGASSQRRRHGRSFTGIRPYGDSGHHLPQQGHRKGEQATTGSIKGLGAAAGEQRWHRAQLSGSGCMVILWWTCAGCREKKRAGVVRGTHGISLPLREARQGAPSDDGTTKQRGELGGGSYGGAAARACCEVASRQGLRRGQCSEAWDRRRRCA